MTELEIEDMITYLAKHPEAGDEISGTGGCRKFRVAGRGKGKSGGHRTITFYSGNDMPLYLLTVFSKGDAANLTKGEYQGLYKLTKVLLEAHKQRVKTLRRSR
jgi:hypothetical protein